MLTLFLMCFYRVVQLNFTPEIDVFHMLFERYLLIFSMKYFHFWCIIQLELPVKWQIECNYLSFSFPAQILSDFLCHVSLSCHDLSAQKLHLLSSSLRVLPSLQVQSLSLFPSLFSFSIAVAWQHQSLARRLQGIFPRQLKISPSNSLIFENDAIPEPDLHEGIMI